MKIETIADSKRNTHAHTSDLFKPFASPSVIYSTTKWKTNQNINGILHLHEWVLVAKNAVKNLHTRIRMLRKRFSISLFCWQGAWHTRMTFNGETERKRHPPYYSQLWHSVNIKPATICCLFGRKGSNRGKKEYLKEIYFPSSFLTITSYFFSFSFVCIHIFMCLYICLVCSFIHSFQFHFHFISIHFVWFSSCIYNSRCSSKRWSEQI